MDDENFDSEMSDEEELNVDEECDDEMEEPDADAQLLMRWRTGDRSAGERLFHKHYCSIERFFLNKVEHDAADDLIQETFKACFEGKTRVQRFRSFLYGVARNKLYDHLRQKYRRGQEIDFETESVAGMMSSPSSLIMHRQEERILLEALRNIPIHDQFILELRFWEGLSAREISQLLQEPFNTVRTWIWRAREHLKTAIQTISNSGRLLRSTISNLDDWASRIKDKLPDEKKREKNAKEREKNEKERENDEKERENDEE